MKKNLFILLALLTLGNLSMKAQTETTAKCGQTVVITATADPGYSFLYWEDDHSLTNPEREVTITSDLDLYNYVAVFQANDVAVETSVNEASMGSVSGAGSYAVGTSVTLTATPASKCYQFKEWSDGVTTASREITVSANAEDNKYKAIFEEVEFTIKVSTQIGGSVTIAKK